MIFEDLRFEPASASDVRFGRKLQSSEQDILHDTFNILADNNAFSDHHGHAFDQSLMLNSYWMEEPEFFRNVKCVPRSYVPRDVNFFAVISYTR